MSKVASAPPTLWQIPDVVGILLLPIALLFVLIDAIVLQQFVYGKDTDRPHIQSSYR